MLNRQFSNNDDLKVNAAGYNDPTAYQAITNVEKERRHKSGENRRDRLLSMIFNLCELSDFHLENRLVLKDKKTGKVWR